MVTFLLRVVSVFVLMGFAGMLADRQPAALQGLRDLRFIARSREASPAELMPDPLIYAGWQYLNDQNQPIALWEGLYLTGHDLAQYILTQQIPVQWGSDAICQGSSCSRLYCNLGGTCTYQDGNPGIAPIYLNDGLRGQRPAPLERAAAELAHEAFHRMQPFGQVWVSQYEEYWAFYLDTRISGNRWPAFGEFDPEDAHQLAGWFTAHNLRGYLDLVAYPDGRMGIEQPIPVTGHTEEVEAR